MATVAIVPSDVISKRLLARRLGTRLSAAGHSVVLLPTTEVPGDPAGIRRRPLALRPPAGVRHRLRPIAQWRANRAAAAALDPAELATAIDELAVDLLIVDIEEYEALIAALAIDAPCPVVVLCSFFEPWPIAGIGPDDPGPPGGRFTRVRARATWWRLWGRMRLYGVKQHLLGDGTDRIPISRSMARRLGVRDRLTSRQWVHPFVPVELPMLVCNALELDVPHRPRPGVHHIGSLLVAPGSLDERDATLAAAVRDARQHEQQIVVCSLGAVMAHTRAGVLDRLDGVAGLRPGCRFFVSTSNPAAAATLSRRENVEVREWLPLPELLAVADAAIVHAGNGTVHECVAARVPMVVYPFAVNDQHRNAARVRRHRVGEIGGPDDDAATMAARLDRVMGDAELRERLDALAEAVARYERDDVAVTVIEALR